MRLSYPNKVILNKSSGLSLFPFSMNMNINLIEFFCIYSLMYHQTISMRPSLTEKPVKKLLNLRKSSSNLNLSPRDDEAASLIDFIQQVFNLNLDETQQFTNNIKHSGPEVFIRSQPLY